MRTPLILLAALAAVLGGVLVLVQLSEREAGTPLAVTDGVVEVPVTAFRPASAWMPTPGSPDKKPAPLSAQSTLRVLVKTTESVPIHQVAVGLIDSAGLVISAALTNAEGVAVLDFSSGNGSQVVCQKAGFARTSETLHAPDTTEVTVVMDTAGVLKGRVLLPAGEPPRETVTVFAHLARAPFPQDMSVVSNPCSLVVRTAENGEFLINDARAGEAYAVYAGCPGYVCASEVGVPATADGPPVQITVAPVYVMAVRFRPPPQTPLPALLHSAAGLSMSNLPEERPGVRCLDAEGAPSAWLAGIPMVHSEWHNREFFQVYSASEDRDSLDPAILSAAFPGFEPVHAEVPALRMRSPNLQWQVIHVRPTANGVGTVELQLRNDTPHTGLPTPEGVGGYLQVRFVPPGSTVRSEEIVTYVKRPTERLSLSSFPAGTYAVRATWFRRNGPALRCVPESIVVTAGASTLASVEIGTFGAIELDPTSGPTNAAFQGKMRVSCSDDTGRSFWSFFDTPPYRVDWLTPGQYRLRVNATQSGIGGTEAAEVTCAVGAQTITALPLKLEVK